MWIFVLKEKKKKKRQCSDVERVDYGGRRD